MHFPALVGVALRSAKRDLLKQLIALLRCDEIGPNWELTRAVRICLLQIPLSFVHSEQILGKRPQGNCPVLCTPCPALPDWLQSNLFHAVPLAKENMCAPCGREAVQRRHRGANYPPRGLPVARVPSDLQETVQVARGKSETHFTGPGAFTNQSIANGVC